VADYGVAQPAGPDDPVAASVAEAQAQGMAYVQTIEQATHAAGDDVGAVISLPPSPDVDATVLQTGPGGS
jgi:hypothetical protein